MKFDTIVITAANAAQARGYREQTHSLGNVRVFADPGGKRVGSLGATVNALRHLPDSGTVLICHSGGDAKRTPAYAAMGKAFVPMPDGRPIFAHIVEAAEKLALPAAGGVLVVSGDVLVEFDPDQADFSSPGVTGVAYRDGADEARRHGVYIAAGRRVTGFLQKPDVHSGRHLIDTGILFIDWPTARAMRALPVSGDIYERFPQLLLAGFAPFSVNIVRHCSFFHIGSTRELLARLGRGGVYVDSAPGEMRLDGDNVVVNVPAGRFTGLHLRRGECLTCLPLGKNEWYDLKYHIDDNFKTDGLWERHALGEKLKRIDYARLLALRAAAPAAVKVTAPVRIDFAGGWSDTPPICEREGGAVLNAAVTLDGKRPIEVIVRPRRDRLVRVVSRDLGKRRLLRSAAEIADHADPHDWCALVKSALTVTGFKFGAYGLDITISADLPKGSGMGTSSILGAATIAALKGSINPAEIGELTLRLEKEMRTGGGWQDQFGGICGGMKLLTSQPGARQCVKVRELAMHRAFAKPFAERSLLFFTGQKRMARNILRRVLSFYAENPQNFAHILVDSLKTEAERAAAAIESSDLKGFAAAINAYWRDKKLLDPGSTNERVEAMIAAVRPFADAVTLTGAGGGGFMYVLAKSAAAAAAARKALAAVPASQYSRIYDFAIDAKGMTIERL